MPPLRVFFPKGNLAKAHAVTNTLPTCLRRVRLRIVRSNLRRRAAGAVPRPAAAGQGVRGPRVWRVIWCRSRRVRLSKSFRTLDAGQPAAAAATDCQVLRFFVWWKNGKERTDIDLSAALFDAEFVYKDIVAYYNLKGYGGCHSGDIVDAPNGASEFIDIDAGQGARTRRPLCRDDAEQLHAAAVLRPARVLCGLDGAAESRIRARSTSRRRCRIGWI